MSHRWLSYVARKQSRLLSDKKTKHTIDCIRLQLRQIQPHLHTCPRAVQETYVPNPAWAAYAHGIPERTWLPKASQASRASVSPARNRACPNSTKQGLPVGSSASSYAAGKVGMKLLTTSQVADKLQLSESTLEDWRWKRSGPPFLRISRGCVRYEEDALEAWIHERMVYELPHSSCPT